MVQVESTEPPGRVHLRHRNGKVTSWDLSQPKAFDFAWVQTPHRLPKQRIDEIHLVGTIQDLQRQKLSQKSRTPITVYRPAPERGRSLQQEHTHFTAPSQDPSPEMEP